MREQYAVALPRGWAMARLDDLISGDGVFSDGDWVESKDQNPNGVVRLVQLADIGEMRFLDKSQRYMSEENALYLNCTFLRRGDLLISRLGDPLGKTCVYPGLEQQAVTAVDVCIFRPSCEEIDPKLFGFFLNCGILRRAMDSQSSGTTRKRITGKKLKALQVPVPPSNEQRRIVEKIETLFARLDQGEAALRHTQQLLARYRQSVLKAAVTGALTADWRAENAHRLEHGRDLLARILQTRRETWQGRGKYKEPTAPDTTGLPELPEGWVWASLDSLADHAAYSIVDGPFGSKLKTSHYTDRGVRVIRLENIGDGEFVDKKSYIPPSHAAELRRHSIEAGDLVIASLGQQLPKACIIPNSVMRAIVKADCIRFSPYKKGVNGKFVLTWLNSLLLRSRVETSIKGVGRPRLNLSDIRAFAVPFPDKSEQDEIARIVLNVEGRIASLEEWCQTELTRSAALRQSILKDAFAGKLVPQDPSDEPAADLLARIRASRTTTHTRKKARA